MCWYRFLCSILLALSPWGAAPATQQTDATQQADMALYRLNPGDVLEVTVWGEPALSGERTVGPDGFIRMPMVGAVLAANLTLDELTERLQQALQKFLRKPRVTVSLKQFYPLFRRVYVLGAVKMPGTYVLPLGGIPTVFDAIALAGGFTQDADLERVQVFQKDGRGVNTYNLKNFRENTVIADNLAINPGDLVWVPPAFVQVGIVGAVEKGGIYPVPTRGTLLDALAAAGGVKEPSATVRVFRAGMEILSIPWQQLVDGSVPPISLQDGDTVLVSVKAITGVVVAGAVKNPGTFDIKGKATVLGALAMAGATTEPNRPMRVRVLRDGKEILQARWDSATPVKELGMELQSGDVVLAEPMMIRATLVGPVRRPGTYELPAGARLADLLSRGEEVLPTADLTSAMLIRKGENKPVDLIRLLWEGDLEEDAELRDGDILMLLAARQVWVVGAVQRPGTLDYRPRMTVMDAISAAGGPRDLTEADLSAVRLVSGGEVRLVNLEAAFKGGEVVLTPIKPGDIVIVPERAKAYIYGAVFKPGAVRVQPGDTVLTLLSDAGGPMPESRLNESVLIRLVNGQAVVMKLNLENALRRGDLSQAPVVQPGDVLYIPPKRRSEWDLSRIAGVASSLALAVYYLSR